MQFFNKKIGLRGAHTWLLLDEYLDKYNFLSDGSIRYIDVTRYHVNYFETQVCLYLVLDLILSITWISSIQRLGFVLRPILLQERLNSIWIP